MLFTCEDFANSVVQCFIGIMVGVFAVKMCGFELFAFFSSNK